MSDSLAWGVLLFFSIVAYVRGIRFHRGSNRSMLKMYRDQTKPRLYRNVPIVAPAYGLLMIAALVAVSPFSLEPILGTKVGTEGATEYVLAVMFPTLFAVGVALLFRPPSFLYPRWLVADDRELGHSHPRATALDWTFLALALVNVALSIFSVGYLALFG